MPKRTPPLKVPPKHWYFLCCYILSTADPHGDFSLYQWTEQLKLYILKRERPQERPLLRVQVFLMVSNIRINSHHDTGFCSKLACALHTKSHVHIFYWTSFVLVRVIYSNLNQTLFQAGPESILVHLEGAHFFYHHHNNWDHNYEEKI